MMAKTRSEEGNLLSQYVRGLLRGVARIDGEPYGPYAYLYINETIMTKPLRKGAEEARSQLPELLTAAQHGQQTIITRHGRPVAVLAPLLDYPQASAQHSLLSLVGTGRGLYGPDSRATLRHLRDEWNR